MYRLHLLQVLLLQEPEAVNRAREEQLIGSHVTVTKVIVAVHGNLVNLVTRS